MIIDPSLIMTNKFVKAGAVRVGESIQLGPGWSSKFLSKMPTPALREALTQQGALTTEALASMGRAKKFVPFRGYEIAVEEVDNMWSRVIRLKKGSRWATNCASIVSENLNVLAKDITWSTAGILNPRSKKNALLSAMVQVTRLRVLNFGKVWKNEYVDFPTDWDWICAPDQVLPLTDESALADISASAIPTPDAPSEVRIVDGVWLDQPLEYRFPAESISAMTHAMTHDMAMSSVIAEITAFRNNRNLDSLLSPSYSQGFIRGGCCYAELADHEVLSNLHPKLQHIIRHVCVGASLRSGLLEVVLPYLRLAVPPSQIPLPV